MEECLWSKHFGKFYFQLTRTGYYHLFYYKDANNWKTIFRIKYKNYGKFYSKLLDHDLRKEYDKIAYKYIKDKFKI